MDVGVLLASGHRPPTYTPPPTPSTALQFFCALSHLCWGFVTMDLALDNDPGDSTW
jgi:hypothetical protein